MEEMFIKTTLEMLSDANPGGQAAEANTFYFIFFPTLKPGRRSSSGTDMEIQSKRVFKCNLRSGLRFQETLV